MKKIVLLMQVLVMATVAMAEGVTPQQALEQARSFMQKREAAGSRMRKAPRAVTQLILERQVSGLYVFNVAGDGGYVIVSNDDRTTPILGFSDSGHVDADNMPDNMRAWLQGYADEIAWLQDHPAATDAKARGQREEPAAKADIAPLISTQWGQRAPYNNLCPEYPSDKNPRNWVRCVTGCVATAMAQVMNLHKWPATTTAIPDVGVPYGWGFTSDLPAISFDWANMADNYTDTTTNAQKTAVAQLMQYCGYAVKTRYGIPLSGADPNNVVTAFTTYFDYSTTVQCVSRSDYSSTDWRDLIYYELENERAVIYCGRMLWYGESFAHAFVCDGYKYEDATDYFHINWGWDGLCDNYFVLSVLYPYEVGGTSTKGYRYKQDAIIGIQPSTSTGIINPEVTAHLNQDNELQVNSISVSKEIITLGESVDVISSFTNNSADVYDVDVDLYNRNKSSDLSCGMGKVFYIAPGETKECVFTVCPEAEATYYIRARNCNGFQYEENCILQVKDQTPSNLSVIDVTTETAAVSWTNTNDASAWNLRYQQLNAITEDFSGSLSELSEWWPINSPWSKHIQHSWRLSSDGGIDGSPCVVVPSYENGKALFSIAPLRTPSFKLGGIVTFYAWGQDEHFYVSIRPDGESRDRYQQDDYVTSLTPFLYTIDLSAYASKTGCIEITHRGYNNDSSHTSDSYLYIDDVTFYEPSDDWSTVSTVTEIPYVLTGLTAGTGYLVQVQAVNTDGGNWSDYLAFTTTKAMDDVETRNVTVNDNEVGAWYTVDGIRFSEKPKRKGIYVHHGRKTIIK